jgi:hypothetical protein
MYTSLKLGANFRQRFEKWVEVVTHHGVQHWKNSIIPPKRFALPAE